MDNEELQKYLAGGVNERGHKRISPRIDLASGENLSVQASIGHYCKPREDSGPYDSVEVGFPSVAPPDTWRKYFDGDWDGDRTASVYGYVPIGMVIDFINEQGGRVIL